MDQLNNYTIKNNIVVFLLTCHFLLAIKVFNRDKSSLAIGHEGTPVPFGFNVCEEKNTLKDEMNCMASP